MLSYPRLHGSVAILVVMGLIVLGVVLCVAGALVARFGYGRPTRDGDYAGTSPKSWAFTGGLVAATGVAVVVISIA
jgi:hypothetical protein